MATRIINVTELKTRLKSVLAELEAEGVPLYVVQHGKPKAVLVEYQEFEAMLSKLEDLEDSLAMQQALLSPEEESISLKDYEAQRAAALQR